MIIKLKKENTRQLKEKRINRKRNKGKRGKTKYMLSIQNLIYLVILLTVCPIILIDANSENLVLDQLIIP